MEGGTAKTWRKLTKSSIVRFSCGKFNNLSRTWIGNPKKLFAKNMDLIEQNFEKQNQFKNIKWKKKSLRILHLKKN